MHLKHIRHSQEKISECETATKTIQDEGQREKNKKQKQNLSFDGKQT